MAKDTRLAYIVLGILLCSVSVAYGNGATPPAPAVQAPVIDPKATQTLKQMSDYLSSLPRFSVHVDAVVEGVTPSGERLDTDRSGDVWVERPNKVRINMISAKHNVQMFYDGNTFTIYSPKQNYYGSWEAPGTIEEMVSVARKKYGLVVPGGDFLASDPYSRLMAHVESATYVGQMPIRGVMTHQLAFRQPDIDWQLWVEADDTPLPRRVVITDRRTAGEPQYMASYSEWNTSPVISPSTFAFTPPAGAKKIEVSLLPSARRQAGPTAAPQPRTAVPARPSQKGGAK